MNPKFREMLRLMSPPLRANGYIIYNAAGDRIADCTSERAAEAIALMVNWTAMQADDVTPKVITALTTAVAALDAVKCQLQRGE